MTFSLAQPIAWLPVEFNTETEQFKSDIYFTNFMTYDKSKATISSLDVKYYMAIHNNRAWSLVGLHEMQRQ